MTIPYHITIGKKLTEEEIDKIQEIYLSTFQEVHAKYNIYNPHSEVSRLNSLKAYEKASLSPEMENFLKTTERLVTLTDGVFDPTVCSLQKLWIDKLESQSIPTEREIQETGKSIGWHTLHYTDGEFYKEHDGTQMDFGGIAKGFCVDLIAERLQQAGFHDALVEWGGELKGIGKHPAGRSWMVCITDPNHRESICDFMRIPLENRALATSGDYFQSWRSDNGNTYSHIIDPRTFSPIISNSGNMTSTSVIAPSCTVADVLATRAMLFDTLEAAKAWGEKVQNENPDITIWFTLRE